MGAKKKLQMLGNCNYAIELGKKLGFSLVSVEGNDIYTGVKTLTLGLVSVNINGGIILYKYYYIAIKLIRCGN